LIAWRRAIPEKRVPEALSAVEVGKEIAEHQEYAHDEHAADEHPGRDRFISIVEAVILSVVALLAAWAGYSAAKWETHRSLSLARASVARTKASLASLEANQIRTLDSVSFNAAATAYASKNAELFRIAVNRLRAGYRPAFDAWLAMRPLKNPSAPPDPSYLPQYKIPQETQARGLNAQADAYFSDGESAAATADKYVRLTVLLAAVLFLVGIGSRFPARVARIGLTGVAAILVVMSLVQLLGLPAPPS
jgi:heme/copper-type cytochrome/quinol oxidase subunit 4